MNERQQAAKNRYLRDKYSKDLIQPSEDKFKYYYPKQYSDMERARERMDIKAKQEKQSKDEYFKKYKTSVHSQQMRNTLKLEEQIKYGKR